MVLKRLSGTLGAVVAVLLVASPASAAPAWLSPIDLSAAGHRAGQPQVAIDPAGNAIAIWNRADDGFARGVIESASRPVGGSWSQPTELSAPGAEAFGPQIAVDPAGNAVAIWFNFDGGVVESASRAVGGSWSPPTRLSATGANIDAHVAVDPSGNAVAIWQRFDGTDSIVESASRPPGGSWSGPVEIAAAPSFAESPRIALDPSGNAVAIWKRINGPGSRIIESASLPVGGSWSRPTKLSATGVESHSPRIAVDSAGKAVAIWQRVNSTDSIIESASLPVGASWSAPTPLSATGNHAGQPQLALDPAGNAVAIWQRDDIIESASLPVGASWSAPTPLSATGNDAGQPQIALDPSGNAVAIWERGNGPDRSIIESASHPLGGNWSGPIGLSGASGPASEAQIALDPSGNAVAIWSQVNSTGKIVQAAAFDGVGPRLQGLVIPARGRARSRLRFSVSALDSWSPLGPVSWRFGDRKRAGTFTATHVYAKPRRYRLTLRVADALGNATSTAATIAIAGPAKAAPLARVRSGRALLAVRCPRPARLPCKGLAQLSLQQGKKKLKLGKRPFRVPGAKRRTVAIKLSGRAKHLLAAAGPKGLAVSLSGDGLGTQTLRLRSGIRPPS